MRTVIVASCGVLVLLGAVLALRWGHLEVEPRWDDGDGVSIGARIQRGLWFVDVHLAGGIAGGLLVLGPGVRLVMRLLAVTAEEQATGRRTEAEQIVGVVSLDGTLGLIIFSGIFGGLLLAAIALLLRKWLPPGRWGALSAGVLFAMIGSTRLDPLRPRNTDFELVGPKPLAILSFLVVGALSVLTIAAVAGRVSRSLPLLSRRPGAIVPYLPLVLLLPLGVIGVATVLGGAVGVVALGQRGFRKVWTSRPVLYAGRAGIALVTVAFLPSFVDDVRSILG
ncbi:MAG TPA: hypothetical protein VM143_18070 [Acidimicrobiales bacterium]|nr:hypothetical protein [Acidimicrobiales bacterium]